MTVYHIALLRLKPEASRSQLEEWSQKAKSMVSKVPGLSLHINQPLPLSVSRCEGFDMGMVAVLLSADNIEGYITDPSHLEVQRLREELFKDALVYDLEF
ncbi:stress responsive A/B barrel domain protein [Talaromyces proteolyticus]|uniref:Stress responsive A/B barrel domain protein n=1 Tax=Talaromyces proteolyticus TaxID=1131652 RepID=A0AAD4KN41_9EURO|nr:stress responsive A/B barrel domain protein [Talaromyces proteolyticus]KAH8695655.1 stress responsive A/B barrel domain protein [Talaromyces proteolyticus]